MTVDTFKQRSKVVGRGIARIGRAAWRERRGNVFILTAFALIPLTFAVGMGIDYSKAMRLDSKLDSIADAASLAAVTRPMLDKSMLTACDAARRTFVSQASSVKGNPMDTSADGRLTIAITETYAGRPTVTRTCPTAPLLAADVGEAPLSRAATVSYATKSKNSFARLLGVSSLPVGGVATARTVKAAFADIYLALDTSQSMGLAATDQDAKLLWEATAKYNGRGCQFGCHERAWSKGRQEPYSNEHLANYFKINLRINVERDAASDMIQTAMDLQGGASLYRFGLYRIGVMTSDIVPLTSNLAYAKQAVSTLTLGPNDGWVGFGDTNLPDMTAYILPRIVARGNGTSSASARPFLFIITDGVHDLAGNQCPAKHCTQVINPSTCDAYKRAGVTVGIVYATYLPTKAFPLIPGNIQLSTEYLTLVAPLASQIAPSLQRCATPGWFFEASDGPSIHAATQKLFMQASRSATLTQ